MIRQMHNLDEVLVNADETANVAARDASDGLDSATHHQNRSLDVLHVQILLFTVDVVGAW